MRPDPLLCEITHVHGGLCRPMKMSNICANIIFSLTNRQAAQSDKFFNFVGNFSRRRYNVPQHGAHWLDGCHQPEFRFFRPAFIRSLRFISYGEVTRNHGENSFFIIIFVWPTRGGIKVKCEFLSRCAHTSFKNADVNTESIQSHSLLQVHLKLNFVNCHRWMEDDYARVFLINLNTRWFTLSKRYFWLQCSLIKLSCVGPFFLLSLTAHLSHWINHRIRLPLSIRRPFPGRSFSSFAYNYTVIIVLNHETNFFSWRATGTMWPVFEILGRS